MSSLAVLRRRLQEVQRAPGLPVMSRYNLATSTLDDDALEQALEPFGAPYGQEGGLSPILNDLLTREPRSVPVTSIQQMQQSLIDQGYAQSVAPDGVWTPYWNSAFRRSDRDADELVRTGDNWTSVPTKKFLQFLGYTVPTEVFGALHGVATGIVQQAGMAFSNPVEAAEEAGALGGLATGALAGAAVAGPVGAAVGGVVGAGVGFFADFFGDDDTEQEEDQDFLHRIWDSLSPYDEYRATGAKHFFAMLDTILIASSVMKGAKLAVQGARGAMTVGATGAQSAGGMLLPTIETGAQRGLFAGGEALVGGTQKIVLRDALKRASKDQVAPGIVAALAKSGVRRPWIGGAMMGGGIEAFPHLLSGDFESAVSEGLMGATVGAGIGAVAGKVLPQKVFDRALKGLDAAPIRRITASPAGKALQSLYTGASVSAIGGRMFGGLGFEGDVYDPKTGQLIEDREASPIAEAIEESPDLGGLGVALDLTLGTFIYPERLLPWRARDVGKAISEVASNHPMIPFARSAQRVIENGQTTFRSFKDGMTRAKQALAQTEDGIDESLVGIRMSFSYLQKGVESVAHQNLRGRGFKDQWDFAAGLSEERAKVIGQVLSDPEYARRLHQEAIEDPWGMTNYLESFEGRGTSLENFAQHQQATEFLQRQVNAIPIEGAPELPQNVAPAVAGKYQTRQDFQRLAGEYETAAKSFQEAWAKSAKVMQGPAIQGELTDSVVAAGKRLDDALSEMHAREMIEDSDYFRLRGRDDNGAPLFDASVPTRLREIAETRAREVPELSKALQDQGFDRYIAVETGENVIRYDHIIDLFEQTGVSAYTRHQKWFDLLASATRKTDEVMELGRNRYNEIAAQLDLAGADVGLDLSGKEMTNKLNKALRKRYDIDAARERGEQVSSWGPIARIETEFGKSHMELFKVDPRDMTPDDLISIFNLEDLDDPYQAANRIKEAVHVGAAFGADAMRFPMHPVQQARALGRGMGLTGLQGFNDFMRTIHMNKMTGWLPRPARNFVGWLPQNAHRASQAIRYSLSPSFDMGRYIEQATLGGYVGEIPIAAAFTPRRFIGKREWRSPYRSDRVTGEDAVRDAMRFYDEEIIGRVSFAELDETQMRLLHRGILGFKPREAEAAQAWYMYQKAAAKGPVSPETISEIRAKVMEIGRYGTGQSPLARSAHFIWFPFLFQTKMFRHLHDFVLGAPVRNLMIHEGMRRWYKVNSSGDTMAEQFSEFMDKHVPLANQLGRLNNLSFGLGPGRFFLEGIGDKSDVGKASQALTAFFVPGGAHQPLQDFVGGTAEVAGMKAQRFVPDPLKHLFVPVVVTEDTPADQLLALTERMVPAYRDLENFIFGSETRSGGYRPGALAEQFKSLPVVGEGAAPMWQMQQYQDARRDIDSELEAELGPMVQSMGYASLDGFLQSDAGAPMKAILDQMDNELGAEFPSGKDLANRFVNTPEMKEQFLFNLGQKDDRTEAEDAIRMLGEMEAQVKQMGEQAGMSQEDSLRIAAPAFRRMALGLYKDPQFRQLWDRWFAYTYGPIAKTLTSGVTA